MRFFYVCVLFFLFFTPTVLGQSQKTLKAERITTPPKIDGIITDDVWKTLPSYSNFYMLEPSNEGQAKEKLQTRVQLAYDDRAVYVAAFMADDHPELIPTQFSQRDDINVQADAFMIALNTYNDGINETRFWVTSAGTIADSRLSQNNQDFNFDVVFQCRVSRDEKGWYAEYKIPYNALRFPEVAVQDWSINFFRRLIRQNETHTWNRVDKSVGQESQYNGLVQGVKNIQPPVRLTFFPFTQGSHTTIDGESTTQITGGLDIKYGLSDSFTLDAQLIPDFGQVAFDNVVLNLGPFEQTFSENRAFFTEGIDLFRKGGIFFTRRIGGGPSGNVGTLGENEVSSPLPINVNLLNSLKISGRTKDNLGVGFLNSISEPTFVEVQDTIANTSREVLVEPLTNYNVFVLDQQFNQNSSISITNTNVTRSGSRFRDANVSALDFNLANNANSYNLSGRAVVSNVLGENGPTTGFRSELDIARTKGNFRFRVGHDFANTTYDINDLGLNFRNNFNSTFGRVSYEIFEPTKVFNVYRFTLTGRHRRLFKPDVATQSSIDLNSFFVLKSRFAFGASADYNSEEDDYFEPRVAGRFVTFDRNAGVNAFISSDYRKKFALDVQVSARNFFDAENQFHQSINISPRYRFSDKMFIILATTLQSRKNEFGYVDDVAGDVFLGQRDITSVENTMQLDYNFNPFKAISLRFRNFWSTADYSSNIFYLLNDDGTRSLTEYDVNENNDPRTNFNIWNLDLSFRWRFAPGSEASLLYRNQIFNSDTLATLNYQESLNNLFDQPIQHTVSLRVTYFLDYNNIKNVFKKSA